MSDLFNTILKMQNDLDAQKRTYLEFNEKINSLRRIYLNSSLATDKDRQIATQQRDIYNVVTD